jgi:hypothetical protein
MNKPFSDIVQAYIDLFTRRPEVTDLTNTMTCNLCGHPIHQLECSSDWVCTEHCCCLMIGCIPKLTWFADHETVRKEAG